MQHQLLLLVLMPKMLTVLAINEPLLIAQDIRPMLCDQAVSTCWQHELKNMVYIHKHVYHTS